MKKLHSSFKLMQKRLDRLAVLLRENLSGGVRVVRSLCPQFPGTPKIFDASEEWQKTALITGRISRPYESSYKPDSQYSHAGRFWGWGVNEISEGGMSKGDIVAYINYLTTILLALIVVANLVVTFTRAAASAQRVNEIFETEPGLAVCDQPVVQTIPFRAHSQL